MNKVFVNDSGRNAESNFAVRAKGFIMFFFGLIISSVSCAADMVWLKCDYTMSIPIAHGATDVSQYSDTIEIDIENSKVGVAEDDGTKWYSAEVGNASLKWTTILSKFTAITYMVNRNTLKLIAGSSDGIVADGQCAKTDGPPQRQF